LIALQRLGLGKEKRTRRKYNNSFKAKREENNTLAAFASNH
jgi:hypothetical protein